MESVEAAVGEASSRRPSIAHDRIAVLLRERYDLDVEVERGLDGEVDQNVVVTDTAGRRLVAKISGSSTDPSHVAMQMRLVEHLAGRDTGRFVPELIRSLDGNAVIELDDPAGHHMRVLTWLPGTPLSRVGRPSREVLREVGAVAGGMVRDLDGFDDPAARNSHSWDLRTAPTTLRDGLPSVGDDVRRDFVLRALERFDETVTPVWDELRTGVMHHDLHDDNLLVDDHGVTGVLDFGDAIHTALVAELAVAVAYGMRRQPAPLTAAADIVAGFHAVTPLTEQELAVLFPLAVIRLCLNAVTWTHRQALDPDDAYAAHRMRGSWDTLAVIDHVDPFLALAVFREACGLEPDPDHDIVMTWLDANRAQIVPVVEVPAAGIAQLDLGAGSDLFDGVDWEQAGAVRIAVEQAVHALSPHLAVAPSGQAWLPSAGRRASGRDEPRSVRLGTLVFSRAGTEVRAPLAGTVAHVDQRTGRIGLAHNLPDGETWFSHYSQVDPNSLAVGDTVDPGQLIGLVRAAAADDPLPDRVDVHLATRALPDAAVPPTFVRPSLRRAWISTCPDATPLLDVAEAVSFTLPADEVIATRGERFARSQRHYYRRPMNLVRAKGPWFYDDCGRAYLDVINNVTHVGHGHPRVVEAVHRQLRKLNTNSRFLYEGIARYSQRLVDLLPDPLGVVFLVCSGSEANDLALRIARQVTGRQDAMVIDGAYHGNTGAVTGISPNRFNGPGGAGAPPTTHVVPQPSLYRGPYGYDHADPGTAYADGVGRVADQLVDEGRPPAAFFAESLMGTAGQVVLPDGYLRQAFTHVRSAGGLCVSDEVQVGFGRMGDRFWGFELGDVVPDIVTMGKPIGNGFPLAAVVTTREIADAFDNGMRYFNTFGGNPVACAAGMAVLDVIEEEGLQARAREAGASMLRELDALRDRHEVVGDVRGQGLYAGVELVVDRASKTPASRLTHEVCERLKDEGVVTYPNGDLDNVIKLKPPMVIQNTEIGLFAEILDEVLNDAIPKRGSRSWTDGSTTDCGEISI